MHNRRLSSKVVVVAVASAAWVLGQYVTLLGPAAVALVLGAAVQAVVPMPEIARRDFAKFGARLLQGSIVLLGASIGLGPIVAVAGYCLPVMLTTVFVGLTTIWLLGGRLRIPIAIRGLLAVGTSICGASAIAAAAPALGATSAEISYAVSVVFLFNFVAVIVFPFIAHVTHMAPTAFAVWAGTSINDTSSVLAATLAFGSTTVASATVVKLSRTLMILPVTVLIALVAQKHDRGNTPVSLLVRRAVPWFAVWFVIAAAVNSVGVVPDGLSKALGSIAGLGVAAALAAVGLATNASAIRRAGPGPLVLAAIGWLTITLLSLVVQRATGLL